MALRACHGEAFDLLVGDTVALKEVVLEYELDGGEGGPHERTALPRMGEAFPHGLERIIDRNARIQALDIGGAQQNISVFV